MMSLRVEVVGRGLAHALDHVEQGGVINGGLAQLDPVLPETAGNDVLYRNRFVADGIVDVPMPRLSGPLLPNPARFDGTPCGRNHGVLSA